MSIVTAAIGKTRAEALKQIEENRTTSSSRLVRFARNLLETLRDQFNKNNPAKIFLTRDRLDKLADEVAKAGAIVPVPKPTSLPASIFEAIKSAALQFGRQYLSKLANPRVSDESDPTFRLLSISFWNRTRSMPRPSIATRDATWSSDSRDWRALLRNTA